MVERRGPRLGPLKKRTFRPAQNPDRILSVYRSAGHVVFPLWRRLGLVANDASFRHPRCFVRNIADALSSCSSRKIFFAGSLGGILLTN